MGKVRILPDRLANQIAAGEVVERPVSALKELVENALDADARRIRVDVQSGGKRLIRVEDDGVGMDREDCLMALERHATSKLTRSEDLFSIKTLGFRGEALPSIASVSRFTLESRQKDAEHGVQVRVEGATLKNVKEVQKAPGTTVTVENLFFNIPARRKFLRTTETELSWIVNIMMTYSFAHVERSFSLNHNGKRIFQVSPVKTLKERVYQHFGKDLVEGLIPFEWEQEDFKIHGFLSKPHIRKTSRNYQFLFVNNRLVRDKMLNHALFEAYREFGETKGYPVVFLFVHCPSAEVDVNVHPAKTEIKFIRSQVVHDWVIQAMKSALVRIPQTTPWRQRSIPEDTHNRTVENPRYSGGQNPGYQAEVRDNHRIEHQNEHQEVLFRPPIPSPSGPSPYSQFLKERQAEFLVSDERGREVDRQEEGMHVGGPEFSQTVHGEKRNPPRVIGQYKESFILAEDHDALLVIDQHVAHERILYDQISASYLDGNIETQILLVPETIELTPAQRIRMEESKNLLKSFGFDIEPFDEHTYAIREVPAFLPSADVPNLVLELVEKAQGKVGETAIESLIQHMAATKACKAAVKINMRLTHEKMQHLINELYQSKTPLFCPHGRPVVLKMSDDEIEKNFLRK